MTSTIDKVMAAADALKPQEALFLPFECVIARTKSGTLRFGAGNFEPIWRRADGREQLAETLKVMLDPNKTGHFASHYRREFDIPSTLRPVPVRDVGRRSFHVDREAMA